MRRRVAVAVKVRAKRAAAHGDQHPILDWQHTSFQKVTGSDWRQCLISCHLHLKRAQKCTWSVDVFFFLFLEDGLCSLESFFTGWSSQFQLFRMSSQEQQEDREEEQNISLKHGAPSGNSPILKKIHLDDDDDEVKPESAEVMHAKGPDTKGKIVSEADVGIVAYVNESLVPVSGGIIKQR